MLGCRELWGDAPAGEQQSRLDVPPLGVAAQRFPSPKVTAAAPCSAEWELREDEQRVGGEGGERSCLQKEEDLGCGLWPVGSCRTRASKNGGGDGAASELAAKPRGTAGGAALLSVRAGAPWKRH